MCEYHGLTGLPVCSSGRQAREQSNDCTALESLFKTGNQVPSFPRTLSTVVRPFDRGSIIGRSANCGLLDLGRVRDNDGWWLHMTRPRPWSELTRQIVASPQQARLRRPPVIPSLAHYSSAPTSPPTISRFSYLPTHHGLGLCQTRAFILRPRRLPSREAEGPVLHDECAPLLLPNPGMHIADGIQRPPSQASSRRLPRSHRSRQLSE